jgi:predicted RNase H-like HicB family nuclease
MFEFRLRILDVREREMDPFSYLGIVEGFPEILVHAETPDAAEANLVNALTECLGRLKQPDETRLELDEFPSVRTISLFLARALA